MQKINMMCRRFSGFSVGICISACNLLCVVPAYADDNIPNTQQNPCQNVFDQTQTCPAIDAEKPIIAADAQTEWQKSEKYDVTRNPAWKETIEARDTLVGQLAVVAGTVGVAAMLLQGTSSFYGAQVEALQNNPQNNLNTDANTAVLQEAIFNRDLLYTTAVGFWITSGIVAGAAGALWLFDPSTGQMRFSIEE